MLRFLTSLRFLAWAIAFVMLLAVSVSSRPEDQAPTNHIVIGSRLERIGLYVEAKQEYLEAIASGDEAVRFQAERALARLRDRLEQVANEKAKLHISLGLSLEAAGSYDEAVAAYQRAFEVAAGSTKNRAKGLIVQAAEKRSSFWRQDVLGWLVPLARKTGLVALLVLILLTLTEWVGRTVASRSSRVEILPFSDAGNTGYGSAFPALLRETYISVESVLQRSVLTYQGAQRRMPVLASRHSETSPEVNLGLGPLQFTNILAQPRRVILRPRYTVVGSVCQDGNSTGVFVELLRERCLLRAWHFSLATGLGSVSSRDCAYEIIFSIIEDWRDAG